MKFNSATLPAILFALAAYTLFTCSDTVLKLALETGIPKYQTLLLQGTTGLLTIFGVTALREQIATLRPHNRWGLFTLSCLYFAGGLCWLTGYAHLPLASFYTVVFMTPFIVNLLAIKLMNEAPDKYKLLAIGTGFLGVIIAIDPLTLSSHAERGIGYLTVFIGMLMLSLQMLLLRVLGRTDHPAATAFYPRFAHIIGGGLATCWWGFHAMTPLGLVYVIGGGVMGAIGWICLAQACKATVATTVAPFQYWQIVVGVILAYLVWGDIPNAHTIIGAAIIVLSGLYLTLYIRRLERRTAMAAVSPN